MRRSPIIEFIDLVAYATVGSN